MTLTATQMGLCLQSYWYLWLTNALSGLLFIGIDIGIAAFFLKKFDNKKKPTAYQRPSNSTERTLSPTHINDLDEPGTIATSRARSALSDDSTSVEENEDFAHRTCQAINAVRQKYGVAPLQVNDQLSEIAQRLADDMARTGKLERSPAEARNFGRQTLGENFTAVFQTALTPEKMVKKWMKEGRKYQFGTNGTRETENFTQLVWQASQEVGVARAQSADGNWWYGIAVFDPPGNIPNQYPSNVLFPEA